MTDDAVDRIKKIIMLGCDDENVAAEVTNVILAVLRPGDELPGGLVVVGKVPTEKMLKAGSDEFTIGASFRAMLAAAKEPPRE